jgi:hypothetical protein
VLSNNQLKEIPQFRVGGIEARLIKGWHLRATLFKHQAANRLTNPKEWFFSKLA